MTDDLTDADVDAYLRDYVASHPLGDPETLVRVQRHVIQKLLREVAQLERERYEWRSAARLLVRGDADAQRKAWAALAEMIDLVDGPE